MTEDNLVVVRSRTTVRSDVNDDIHFDVNGDETFNISQDNDRVFMSRASAVALAKVILQHTQVGFQPIFHEEVDYSA
jgi:hypothetical protein